MSTQTTANSAQVLTTAQPHPVRHQLFWLLAAVLIAVGLPYVSNDYWVSIGTRAAIYWVLISGLNLVVGFAGQLAIGYVALLTIGAYTTSVLTAGKISDPISVWLALPIASVMGAIFGVIVGLPALRLRTFYFAMTTLGFATIVTQIALAWQSVTGGGIGIPGPEMPAPFDDNLGFYYLCLALAAVCTWLTANIARSRFGSGLIAVRDAEVAAEACGISKSHLLIPVFILAGALAAFSGGLFAGLQTYVTPDAFTFELSLLFFISILIGGRGSIYGPMIGTIILVILPEIAAPLAAWSTFLYAFLLLVIVLAMPGGIAVLLDFNNRRPLAKHRTVAPETGMLAALNPRSRAENNSLSLKDIVLTFGSVRAIDGVTLDVKPGKIHGLIGPNGSGKTTTLNVISGYYSPNQGTMTFGQTTLPPGLPHLRASRGIARTFQTPRIVGEISVLENVMIGGATKGKASFLEALLAMPKEKAERKVLRDRALALLAVVGLGSLAHIRTDRLQHSELRFIEIARALMIAPDFLMLDEPAAGLSGDEINKLGELIQAISACGTGVLLVEHHVDLIFAICDDVTVLNLGKILAAGTPDEIRAHKEVVNAYLGG